MKREAGAVPLYAQIADVIEDKITDYEMIGSYLPSQLTLCVQFNVSRITIRKAMEELHSRGTVVSERAKGARILRISEKQSLFHGISFSSRYQGRHGNSSSRILQLKTGYYNMAIGEILGDSAGRIILLKRVRLVDDVPVAVETSYVRYSEPLETAMFSLTEESSLYRTLFRVHGWNITRAEERIQAVMCEEKELMQQLQTERIPILYTSRKSFDQSIAIPVEYCESYIKSECYGVVSYTYTPF